MSTIGTRRHFNWVLLVLAVSVAVSFGWLFHAESQRAADLRALAKSNRELTVRLTDQGRRSFTSGFTLACAADNRTLTILRVTLAKIRDNHQVPLTAAQTRDRVAVYNRLIRRVELRRCSYELARITRRSEQ